MGVRLMNKFCQMGFLMILMVNGSFLLGHQGHHPPKRSKTAGKDTQRQAFYEARLQKNPSDLFALGRLGNLHLERARHTTAHRDFLAAESYFERMLVLYPESLEGMRGLATCLSGRHQFNQALGIARQFAERQPQKISAWTLLGDTHFALGNYLEAEALFERVLGSQRDLAGLARMAQIAEVRGDLKKAEALYHEAIGSLELNQKASRAWCLTMIAELELQRGALSSAQQRFQSALAIVPEMHYAHWRLAELAQYRGELNEAKIAVARALEFAPEHPGYQFTQARIAAALGSTAKARVIRAHSIKAIRDAVAKGDLGHIREWVKELLHSPTQHEKALELAALELAQVRHDAEAHELHAWLLHMNGCSKDAVSAMDRALAPGGRNPTTLLRAGIIYAKAGINIKALLFLDRGLSSAAIVDPQLKALANKVREKLQTQPVLVGQSFPSRSQAGVETKHRPLPKR